MPTYTWLVATVAFESTRLAGRQFPKGETVFPKGEIVRRIVLMSCLALLSFMFAQPQAAYASGNPNPGVLPPNSHAFGKTYGEWSAAWWQYVFSIPLPDNPLFDDTGAKCGVGQSGQVFFLVGKFLSGSSTSVSATRDKCTVPAGTPLFFPILNSECDNVGGEPPPETVPQLRVVCKSTIDGATNMSAEVDGVEIKDLDSAATPYRVTSPVFSYTLPENNIYQAFGLDVPAGTYEPAVADGVFLMLAPLSPGSHTINFHGELSGFTLDITYHLTVVNQASI
jgi:hypothetical protein